MKGTVKRLCYYWLQQNSGMKNEVCQTARQNRRFEEQWVPLIKEIWPFLFIVCIFIFFIFLQYVGGFLVLIEKILLNRMAGLVGPLSDTVRLQWEHCTAGEAGWVFTWQSFGDRTGFLVEMVVDCHGFNLTPKNALLWERTCTCMLHGSCFCSARVRVCVCARARVVCFSEKKVSHWVTNFVVHVWPRLTALVFAGASRLASRAQARAPLCRRRRRLTFHSLSQQLSGLKLYRGEARILRISCQGQARELQGPDCLSKRTRFQSDRTSSAKTSK